MRWVILIGLVGAALAELNVPELLINEKDTGNSGVKGRLSRKGVQYVSHIVTSALITEVVTANVNLSPQKVKVADGSVLVSDFNVHAHTAVHTLNTDIQKPSFVLLTIGELNLTATAKIFKDEASSEALGTVTFHTPATSVDLKVEPKRSSLGAPNMKIHECKVSFQQLDVVLGDTIEDKEPLQVRMDAEAQSLIEGLICARIEYVVEDRINDRFGLLSRQITLAHIGDDELVKDLADRMRARRQRRNNPRNPWGGNLGAGMRLPMGFNLGAGLGRRKRHAVVKRDRRHNPWSSNVGAGMRLPMGFNPGAGIGRKRRDVEAVRQRRSHPRNPWGGNLGAGMRLPMGFNLGAGLGRKKRDAAVIRSFNVSHMDTLFLDYTITRDIVVTDIGIEIESSGEVSLRGRGGTPFGPMATALPENVHEDSMLQMVVSDYMPNSLMYHGHTIGLFSTRVDPTTPHFGPIMRTSCSLSSGMLFCLGDLFPTLRKVHPEKRLALNFNTLQAPVILFRPASAGGIAFSLLGRIAILVIDPKTKAEEQVAEMRIDVNAQMKMRLTSSMVRPKITLERIKLTTMSPGILLQNELDDAVMLAREVLQRMVNDLLKEGIPIPVHPLFRLNKPKVKIIDRALLLQTNFELNEQLMRQLTAGDLERRRRL